jgi:hypothetical protein
MLIISFNSFAHLQSVGINRQQIRLEQSSKLNEYREEMKAFTVFLKQKFIDAY